MSGWRPGLVVTDDLLARPDLPSAAKDVAGVSLGLPNRNPSISQLVEYLGIKRDTAVAAQRELESVGFRYHRPSRSHDREKDSRRYRFSNRIIDVPDFAEPLRAGIRKIELPAPIRDRLKTGKKNAAHLPLLAAVYARDQLKRGAIQLEDEVAAFQLGGTLTPRQVGRLRHDLLDLGVLNWERRSKPCAIYTMPGATLRDPDVDDLDPARTRLLLPLHVGGQTFTVYASRGELGKADRLARQTGADATIEALARIGVTGDATVAAALIIDALTDAPKPTVTDRWGDGSRSFRGRDLYPVPEELSKPYGDGASRREADAEDESDVAVAPQPRSGSSEELALTDTDSEGLSGAEASTPPAATSSHANTSHGDGLPNTVQDRLVSIFGEKQARKGSKAYERVADAWTLLVRTHGGDLTAAQLEVATRYALAQLARVADALAHGGERAAYPALTTACGWLRSPDGATREALKQAGYVRDDTPPAGEVTFDLDALLPDTLYAVADPDPPPPRPVEPVDRDELADLDSVLKALLSKQECDYTIREAHARATACDPDLYGPALVAYLKNAADQAMGLGLAA